MDVTIIGDIGFIGGQLDAEELRQHATTGSDACDFLRPANVGKTIAAHTLGLMRSTEFKSPVAFAESTPTDDGDMHFFGEIRTREVRS